MLKLEKREVDEMMKLKGNVRGHILKGHFDYIEDKNGQEGVLVVEKRLEELGYPIKAAEIKKENWYSEALSCLIIITYAEVFNSAEKKVFEMAYKSSRYSIIVKLLLHYFISLEKSFGQTPIFWRKHFDFAELKPMSLDVKEKYFIFRILDFHKYHPLLCEYHKGYFKSMAELMTGSEKVKVEHTKCLFGGDPYEEFKISWE